MRGVQSQELGIQEFGLGLIGLRFRRERLPVRVFGGSWVVILAYRTDMMQMELQNAGTNYSYTTHKSYTHNIGSYCRMQRGHPQP